MQGREEMMATTQGEGIRRGLGALALAAAVVLPGCAETEVQGLILDDDLVTEDLMIGLARGMQSEFEDPWVASNVFRLTESPTDAITNDDNGTGDELATVSDFRNRPGNAAWAQFQEASWAALFARQRYREVYSPQDFQTSPFAARNMLLGGYAERFLGETFCEMIYNYGLEGGILLDGDNPPYDPSRLVPRDSAFKRSIAMIEIALEHAEAGIAAGVPVPEDDPVFDPQVIRTAAFGGLAQAYANLGDWTQAKQYAAMVPDDFADYAYASSTVDGGLDLGDTFRGGDDLSLYRTQGALLWEDDPRLALSKCGEWRPGFREAFDDDPTVPLYQRMDGTVSNAGTTWFFNRSSTCGHRGSEYRSENNRYPLYITLKIDDSTNVEIVSGAEMRLIEAEAALLAGDLVEFTNQVNRARAVRGLDPIDPPTTAGALEYPNAEDDAWSILDRERYLETFLEGKRFWDLSRWNHPFFTGDHVLLPRHQEFLSPVGRMDCQELGHQTGTWGLPIPDQECDTNPQINCPVIGG